MGEQPAFERSGVPRHWEETSLDAPAQSRSLISPTGHRGRAHDVVPATSQFLGLYDPTGANERDVLRSGDPDHVRLELDGPRSSDNR